MRNEEARKLAVEILESVAPVIAASRLGGVAEVLSDIAIGLDSPVHISSRGQLENRLVVETEDPSVDG